MSYRPKMCKVRQETYEALQRFASETLESATKGRRDLPDLQMEGISIDYAIRLLLKEHYATVERRRKADEKRVKEGKRRKNRAKSRPQGESGVNEA